MLFTVTGRNSSLRLRHWKIRELLDKFEGLGRLRVYVGIYIRDLYVGIEKGVGAWDVAFGVWFSDNRVNVLAW